MADEEICIETPSEPQAITPRVSFVSANTMSPKNQNVNYKNLTIQKCLSKGKFPVFLVHCENNGKSYAMKLFPFQGSKPDLYFQNEARFISLSHPHIIKAVYSEEARKIHTGGSRHQTSLILAEYAPNGDFFSFVAKYSSLLTDKLIRTYFRQLIQGLEFLHNNQIMHLDIKLENLLLDKNFLLKIADFDLSSLTTDTFTFTNGTKYYRAPEIIHRKCRIGPQADIYSAGIILFAMITGGKIPHTESADFQGVNLNYLLHSNPPEFWKKHCEFQKRNPSDFPEDFKDLFMGMTKEDPRKRLTIPDIKRSVWYNGPIFINSELKDLMQKMRKM